MNVGRNDPCPCGSGKKYKRCCLQTDEQASRPPGQEWHDLDGRLGTAIGQWAKRRFGDVWSNCPDQYPIDFEEQVAHFPLFHAWAVYERKIDGRPVASWFLEERGRHLLPEEHDWVAAQLRSWLSVWEVLDVAPGKSARLKDLFTGEERPVSEVAGSRSLTPNLLVLARVVDHAGLSLVAGNHPAPLAPTSGRDCVDTLRAELGLGKRVNPQELREGDRPTTIIDAWHEMVEFVEDQPLPELRNSDGEELVLLEDHYKLVGKGAKSAVEAELSKLRGVHSPKPDARERRYTVVREEGTDESGPILASIVVKAREVVVETNSRKRADVLRGRLEEICKASLTFTKREETDAAAILERADAAPKKKAPAELAGPEVDAMLRDFKARHYATWADHGLPALDGLTPREAAGQPKYRARLETLLKEMEFHESQEDAGRRFDFSTIRRVLGIV